MLKNRKQDDRSATLGDIAEAAFVDLARDPMPLPSLWSPKRNTLEAVERHARRDGELDDDEVEAMYRRLRRKKIFAEAKVTAHTSDVTVTEKGVSALRRWVGLRDALPIPRLSAPKVAELRAWLRDVAPSHLDVLHESSRIPFSRRRRVKEADLWPELLRRWRAASREDFVLAALQGVMHSDCWPGRDTERLEAIQELNHIFRDLGVLMRFDGSEMGTFVPRAEARHEELALGSVRSSRYSATSTGPATGAPENVEPLIPMPPPEAIPWRAKEEVFTKRFLIPLLQRVDDLSDVRYVGGRDEHGVDVLCWYFDPLGERRWVGVQVKMSLPGSTAKIAEVTTQMDRAFRVPFDEPRGGGRIWCSEVWVLVASPLSDPIRKEIVQGVAEPARKRNVKFVDRPQLETLYRRSTKAMKGSRG